MLTICKGVKPDRHEEIAIEGIDCPACEALEKLREARERLLEANQKIEEQDYMILSLRHPSIFSDLPEIKGQERR